MLLHFIKNIIYYFRVFGKHNQDDCKMFHYMKAQIKKIEIDKWYEGCRIKRDPGYSYILDWINKNAARFRSAWELSCCRECLKSIECGHQVLEKCDSFEKKKEL